MIVVLFIVTQFIAMGCVSAYGLHLEKEEQKLYRESLMSKKKRRK